MARFSTHILSSLDGTHLSDIVVLLIEISRAGERRTIMQERTDKGGRINTEFKPNVSEGFEHEVIISIPESFSGLDHWAKLRKNTEFSSISVKVKIVNKDGSYHMPFILSPYGFSGWISR
tara:strand:+ start:745 stop:1104 length:360 start_codon:yes stop_codon:yes gene_type:complete